MSARLCRRSPTMRPKANTRAKGMSGIAAHWRRFVSGVGFSKAEAEFAPLKPPPFVPSCLIATWDDCGAERYDRLGHLLHRRRIIGIDESPLGINAHRLQKLHHLIALKRLGRSLPYSHQSEHQRQGQQHVEHRAHDIDEEVPELAAVRRCQAPQQRECHRDADGRRKEVLHRQTNRLREVAQIRLTGDRLPIGVRHKARRHIEGRIERKPRKALGVPRQCALADQQDEEADKAYRRKGERTGEKTPPIHAIVLARAHKTARRALERAQRTPNEKGPTFHHVNQVPRKREGAGHDERHQHACLQKLRPRDRAHRCSPPRSSKTAKYAIAASANTPTIGVTTNMILPLSLKIPQDRLPTSGRQRASRARAPPDECQHNQQGLKTPLRFMRPH